MSADSFLGLRAKLHASGPLYFAQTMFPDPGLASILGSCGFDFVMIDAEHGPFSLPSLQACIEALSAAGTPAVVRTASHSEVEVKQVLDLGAEGVMIPRVASAAEARAIVQATRYPPDGIRGLSRATRACRYGADENYATEANSRLAVIAIIESSAGLKNIREIVSVPGIDGIMVGRDDLAADLGIMGQYTDPAFLKAVDTIVEVSLSAGLKVGGRPPRTRAESEAMLVHCGNDAIAYKVAFATALREQRARVDGL